MKKGERDVWLFLAREILEIIGITISETGEPGTNARFEILVPRKGYRFGTSVYHWCRVTERLACTFKKKIIFLLFSGLRSLLQD